MPAARIPSPQIRIAIEKQYSKCSRLPNRLLWKTYIDSCPSFEGKKSKVVTVFKVMVQNFKCINENQRTAYFFTWNATQTGKKCLHTSKTSITAYEACKTFVYE